MLFRASGARPRFSIDGTDDLAVGFVYGGCVQRSQVDACGALRGVSHGFADGANGNPFALGNTGPGVPGTIRSQRDGTSYHAPDDFQVTVQHMQGVQVLASFAFARRADDGQEEGRFRACVPVHDFLHGFLPPYGKKLVGFAAAVGQQVVLPVLLP